MSVTLGGKAGLELEKRTGFKRSKYRKYNSALCEFNHLITFKKKYTLNYLIEFIKSSSFINFFISQTFGEWKEFHKLSQYIHYSIIHKYSVPYFTLNIYKSQNKSANRGIMWHAICAVHTNFREAARDWWKRWRKLAIFHFLMCASCIFFTLHLACAKMCLRPRTQRWFNFILDARPAAISKD